MLSLLKSTNGKQFARKFMIGKTIAKTLSENSPLIAGLIFCAGAINGSMQILENPRADGIDYILNPPIHGIGFLIATPFVPFLVIGYTINKMKHRNIMNKFIY
jgi:hypothetical protein